MKEYTYHDVNLRGTVERVRYRTTNREGQARNKTCLVYLPHGYNENDPQTRYDILYVLDPYLRHETLELFCEVKQR